MHTQSRAASCGAGVRVSGVREEVDSPLQTQAGHADTQGPVNEKR